MAQIWERLLVFFLVIYPGSSSSLGFSHPNQNQNLLQTNYYNPMSNPNFSLPFSRFPLFLQILGGYSCDFMEINKLLIGICGFQAQKCLFLAVSLPPGATSVGLPFLLVSKNLAYRQLNLALCQSKQNTTQSSKLQCYCIFITKSRRYQVFVKFFSLYFPPAKILGNLNAQEVTLMTRKKNECYDNLNCWLVGKCLKLCIRCPFHVIMALVNHFNFTQPMIRWRHLINYALVHLIIGSIAWNLILIVLGELGGRKRFA